MIETEQQRRWWFATHPEYSWSNRGGGRSRGRREDDEDSDRLSPEEVDAGVDEALKYERDPFQISLLNDIKFFFGTEFASKSPEEKRLLLWAEEEFDEEDDNLGHQSGNDWWSDLPSGHPAADRSTYDKYEDVLDIVEHHLFLEWLEQVRKADVPLEPDPITALDVIPFLRSAMSPIAAIRAVLRRMARDAVLSAAKPGRPTPRLPPKGTRERAIIEAARNKGVRAKKREELADIRAGGKGSGVWSEQELAEIRRTGKFPLDAQWHHDPTVANRPELAADPRVVQPVRGGTRGHLDAHGRSFMEPRE